MRKRNITEEFKRKFPNGVLVDSYELLFDESSQTKKTKRKKLNLTGVKMMVFGVVATLLFVFMSVVQFL